MTEAERMEEGRRMFQIFAARMFEQRVLTAYREKVSLISLDPLSSLASSTDYLSSRSTGRLRTAKAASSRD